MFAYNVGQKCPLTFLYPYGLSSRADGDIDERARPGGR